MYRNESLHLSPFLNKNELPLKQKWVISRNNTDHIYLCPYTHSCLILASAFLSASTDFSPLNILRNDWSVLATLILFFLLLSYFSYKYIIHISYSITCESYHNLYIHLHSKFKFYTGFKLTSERFPKPNTRHVIYCIIWCKAQSLTEYWKSACCRNSASFLKIINFHSLSEVNGKLPSSFLFSSWPRGKCGSKRGDMYLLVICYMLGTILYISVNST